MTITREFQQKLAKVDPIPSIAGNTLILPITTISLAPEIKKSWWRKITPCLAFFAAFTTAMTLLVMWSEAAALRRQAFDANMTRDYVLSKVPMDDPQLVVYIREVQFQKTVYQEPITAVQTSEEKFIENHLKKKYDGVYVEYINRPGAESTTSWLEANYGWRGLLVITDFRSFFKISKSGRHSRTRVLHACLSTDKATKEITYHQESDVRVTKLSEGPNSLIFSEEGQPAMRLKCFPLYSILLAYNQTTIDYLSLDSNDLLERKVLDTIPWNIIKISVLAIRWSEGLNNYEFRLLINKLGDKHYKLSTATIDGKLIFTYLQKYKI
ncbi:hypothetical protein HCN44_004703 [Aphidius gifuensis]|uniref:Uncharacterized protein n=1 Tax=Aphidius gifuensis TaxID=684658 RepID=A0A834XYK8_APHGI|nr:protein Star-like [Aphidius gifuensis]KAF7995231.1 hypothetical protein HCN44_004703 [Aphidius gifuensis]